MKKVFLINQRETPHYRIAAYDYISEFLKKEGYLLTVVSEGIQQGNKHQITYDEIYITLNFVNLLKLILNTKPDVVIYWIHLRLPYLFPLLVLLKLLRIKSIYWGHGTDLLKRGPMLLKNFAHYIEFLLSDALILYADHLKKNIKKKFHSKIFVANNTLNFNNFNPNPENKSTCLSRYNISTKKNIICMGRMQKRKKIDHLYKAFELLNRNDVGLILVGPDNEGILCDIKGKNIFIIPPIYDDERLDLLSASDIFCLPGAVGLSIVDAFYCSLPFITEDGDMSPEIMYLKNGVNGFVVPMDDIRSLTDKLRVLLDNDELRARFSSAAKAEITTNGNMDIMCKGFLAALNFVCNE